MENELLLKMKHASMYKKDGTKYSGFVSALKMRSS